MNIHIEPTTALKSYINSNFNFTDIMNNYSYQILKDAWDMLLEPDIFLTQQNIL